MATRVSPEIYKKLLQKCADGGCSTYEYLRQLVHLDVGLDEDEDVPEEPVDEVVQTELKVEDERNPVENGIIVTRE